MAKFLKLIDKLAIDRLSLYECNRERDDGIPERSDFTLKDFTSAAVVHHR